MTHTEFSKKGGQVKSAQKTKAARENVEKARAVLAKKRSQGSGTGLQSAK